MLLATPSLTHKPVARRAQHGLVGMATASLTPGAFAAAKAGDCNSSIMLRVGRRSGAG